MHCDLCGFNAAIAKIHVADCGKCWARWVRCEGESCGGKLMVNFLREDHHAVAHAHDHHGATSGGFADAYAGPIFDAS